MFNKYSRSCVLSDELEKGNVLHTPFFRFLSFSVCLALMLCIFSIIPFPASAESGIVCAGESDITDYGSYNGYNIYNNNKIRACSLSSIYKLYGDCCVFAVLKCGDNFYLPSFSGNSNAFSCIEYYIHNDGQYIYSYTNSSRDQYIYKCTDTQHFLHCGLKIDDTGLLVTDCEGSHYIKRIFDFNGHDVTSNVDLSNSTCMWAIYPNRDWDKLNNNVGYRLTTSLLSSTSDGSGFVPSSSQQTSKAHFACFDDYVDYPLSEFSTNLSNGSYMTKRETLTTGHTRLSFLFDDINTARSWQSVYNTPKMPLYTSKEISFNYFNGNTGGSSIYLKISKAQFMPNVREDDNLISFGYFVMRPANTLIENYCQISGGSLNGCEPGRTYTYKINLQGFCDLNYNSFYCIEIYEVGNSTPLTSCVYVYGGEDTLQQNSADKNKIEVSFDVSDGDNSSSIVLKPDENGQMGVTDNMVSDDTFAYSSYNFNNMDVSQIFGTLQQSTANIGLFFNACYNIIPYSIIAIITAALTLLVILRILGR